ncbi:MAG: YfcC family protein [Vicinamibacterales bacterium]
MARLRLPHPLIVLLACVGAAAALTWIVPAGEFERRPDPLTGRAVVVAGSYHRVPANPVGPIAAAVAVPRGFIEAADVVAVILFVGGAWVVLDDIGALERIVAAFLSRFRRRSALAVPVVCVFFASMGALENMQEEIIPLVPVLLMLGRRLGMDAVSVVAMSAGAAMVGSAFGPTNPFQAGIALELAELPPLSGGLLRLGMWVVATLVWLLWIRRYVGGLAHGAVAPLAGRAVAAPSLRDGAALAVTLMPMALYVYGAAAWGWGFNELSAGFFVGALAAGLIGGLTLTGTSESLLKGMRTLVAAAVLVGLARSISLVLTDGRVIDTILQGLSQPLAHIGATSAALLMIPFHMLVHVAVPSVSGQAVLTMPVLVPLCDLVGVPRLAGVIAYQTGAGLMELLTPTNGALMAILLAAGVPLQRWLRFAIPGVMLLTVIGIVAILVLN